MKEEITTDNRKIVHGIFRLEIFALFVQFYLMISDLGFTFLDAIVRFFSFFTILTNILVAIYCAFILYGRKGKWSLFFQKESTITAITVYILIVGLVFNLVLRPMADLKGMHQVVSEIFHTVVPLLFLIYWIIVCRKANLSYKVVVYWLIYPLIYVVYTLLHGIYSGFYPYPFIDVSKLGYNTAIRNGIFILVGFVLVSLVLVFITRFTKNNKETI